MHVASIEDKFDHPEVAVQLTGSKHPVTKYLSHALHLTHTHTPTPSKTQWQALMLLSPNLPTTPHPFFPNPLLQSDLCPSWPRQWLWRCLCCQRSGWAPDQSERWSAEIQDRPAGTEPAPHGTKLHTHKSDILHVNHCSSLYIDLHAYAHQTLPTNLNTVSVMVAGGVGECSVKRGLTLIMYILIPGMV